MDFHYQAKNSEGAIFEGNIEAPSEDQAVSLLQQKGLLVLQILEIEKGLLKGDLLARFNKPSRKDLIIFTRQLSTLIQSDVPLLEALHILNRQVEKDAFRKVITSIIGSIEGGASLSIALSEHEKIFGRFYVSLVRVGEVSGKLQETLLYMADYLERSAALTSKIRGALFYPAFVLFALAVVTVILMTTVVPQLLTIIKDSGVTELPIPTKILIAVSGFFQNYILLIIILAILIVVALYQYSQTPKGKYNLDKFKLDLPKFGRIVRDLYLARMAETLATLIRAGVPILESVATTADVVGNEVYKSILLEAKQHLQGGGSLSEILQKHEEFPPLVSSMLGTGERTGRTDYMLENILKFYKTEAENDVANISQLIEPLLILLLGVGIGGLVAAILLPIYSLINVA